MTEEEKKNKPLMVYISDEMHTELARRKTVSGVPVTEQVRRAIAVYLEEEKSPTDGN